MNFTCVCVKINVGIILPFKRFDFERRLVKREMIDFVGEGYLWWIYKYAWGVPVT